MTGSNVKIARFVATPIIQGNIPATSGSLVRSVLHPFLNTFRAAHKSGSNNPPARSDHVVQNSLSLPTRRTQTAPDRDFRGMVTICVATSNLSTFIGVAD